MAKINYVISVFVSIVITILNILYLKKHGIVFSDKNNFFADNQEQKENVFSPFSKKKSIFICIIVSVVMVGISVYLANNIAGWLNYCKFIILTGIIISAAFIDLKKKIIPNFLILIGLVSRVVVYIIEYFTQEEFKAIFLNDIVGFCIGFGILLVSALLTRQAIGFGDVKLFGVIGLLSGTICTFSTLIVSLVTASIVSIILMVLKKKGKKETLPFAPCILVGYCFTIFFANY